MRLARTLRTRTFPWFGLAAVLIVVDFVALHGTAHAIVGSAAFFTCLFAFIRYVGLGVRDDPVRSQVATRSRVAGVLLTEYADARRRRRAVRARRRGPEGGAADGPRP